jgi:Phage T4 tail fibre
MKTKLLYLLLFVSAIKLSAQNIGINTATPLRTFSVNGSIIVDQTSKNFGTLDSASLVFGSSPMVVGISSNKAMAGFNPRGLDFWTNNFKRMSVTENGNVGVGISAAVSKFQVGTGTDVSFINHGYLMLGTDNNLNIAMDNNEIQARNNGASSTLFLQALGGTMQVGATSENNLRIQGPHIQSYFNGSNDELILNGISGGKVRLGGNLDFATTKLHISSGVDAGLTDALSGFMMIGPSNGENVVFDNNEILARTNGVASTLFLGRDGSKVQLGNGAEAAGTKLHITSGSDVGLTDALSGHLMLGSQAATNMIFDQNEIQARNNGAASNLYMQYSGGNMALGQITPTTQLHMTGDLTMQSSTPILQLKNSAGTNMVFVQMSGIDARLGTNFENDLGKLIFSTNGTNRMYINPTGQISIGTATPATGYMLSVNGKAMVEELKVQLSGNWPDYVFSNKYKLKNFDELREFIDKNNHLPNIPAASEIEKSGLEVGEMQRLMMEKIEELTLYVLQLEKKIKDVEKQ